MLIGTGEARQAAQPDAAWPLCHIPEHGGRNASKTGFYNLLSKQVR